MNDEELKKIGGKRWMWLPELIICFVIGHKFEYSIKIKRCTRCNLLTNKKVT